MTKEHAMTDPKPKTYTITLRGARRSPDDPVRVGAQELSMTMLAAARAVPFYGISRMDEETGHLINGRLSEVFAAVTIRGTPQVALTDTAWTATVYLTVGTVRVGAATHTLRRCDLADIMDGAGKIGLREGGTFFATIEGATHLPLGRQVTLDLVDLGGIGKHHKVHTVNFPLWNAARRLTRVDDGTDAGQRQIAASGTRRMIGQGATA
jgi:hypothetical protein